MHFNEIYLIQTSPVQPLPLPDPNYLAAQPLHCSSSRPPQGPWWQCANSNHWETQACPCHTTTHGYHGRAIIAPPTVDPPAPRVVTPSQRVKTTPPPRLASTSNNLTSPNVIRQIPLIQLRHTCSNNLFHILADDDNDGDTVVASNFSPHAPRPILPSSNLSVNLPVHPSPRQLSSQPALPSSTVQPSILPPKVLAIPSFILATTPTVPYNNVHYLQPNPLWMPF